MEAGWNYYSLVKASWRNDYRRSHSDIHL